MRKVYVVYAGSVWDSISNDTPVRAFLTQEGAQHFVDECEAHSAKLESMSKNVERYHEWRSAHPAGTELARCDCFYMEETELDMGALPTDAQVNSLLDRIYIIGLAKPDEQVAYVKQWFDMMTRGGLHATHAGGGSGDAGECIEVNAGNGG